MSNVIIYSKDYCPYCKAAKALLDHKALPFTEIEVSTNTDKLAEMVKLSKRRTVPQIFIDGNHIGGYDDLQVYFASGKSAHAA